MYKRYRTVHALLYMPCYNFYKVTSNQDGIAEAPVYRPTRAGDRSSPNPGLRRCIKKIPIDHA